MLKTSKLNFFSQLNVSTPKEFWKIANYYTKQKSAIPVLKDAHGQTVSDDVDKAKSPQSHKQFQLDFLSYPDDFLCLEEEVMDLLLNLDTSKPNVIIHCIQHRTWINQIL